MTQFEAIAHAVLDGLGDWSGATEFKRTVQHDDGTHESLRIDIIEADADGFLAVLVRQKGEGPRQESGPARFSRLDPKRFAQWLDGTSAAKVEAGIPNPDQ